MTAQRIYPAITPIKIEELLVTPFVKCFNTTIDDQHHGSHKKVWERTEIPCTGSASERVDSHRDQGQADGHDHRTGDHRRKEPPEGALEKSQNSFKQAANNACSQNGSVCGYSAAHGGCHSGTYSSIKPELVPMTTGRRATYRPDGEQLYKGYESGHQHGILQNRYLKRAACT